MELNLLEHLMIFRDESRRKQINLGINEVRRQIDIETYFEKLQEIETLKTLLLTEDQRNLMSLIIKPDLDSPCKMVVKPIIDSYLRVAGNKSDQVNNKLLSMLNPDV